ncbi:hypothetical protein [uncultured Selenomonas sp.]|uniref:hypothetical protein n=1 Tax=uncultured Selenomonas sp. TaxID=159275 RepID=UPI0028E3CC59|nr:hypothetical protein [uncultured Selenomonas sp.]
MSEYRVGIITEGPTDIHLITGILENGFPSHRFLPTLLSPTQEELDLQKKDGGFGWRSVYLTCRELKDRLAFSTCVGGFDFLVIHIDGDVAYHRYEDAGIVDAPGVLPCAALGDEIGSVCAKLEGVLSEWIGNMSDTPQIVFCIPYISTETWAGALVFPESWGDVSEDCNEDFVSRRLVALGRPKAEKARRLVRQSGGQIKKVNGTYSRIGEYITCKGWRAGVCRYRQAEKFDNQLKGSLIK